MKLVFDSAKDVTNRQKHGVALELAEFLFQGPHLTVADVKGHSIMIHVGGDNYSDQPAPLGGGGARIACGVVE